MLIRIDGTSINPGHSAGVEAFTYGLISGLADTSTHDLQVEILEGTEQRWRDQVASERISWSEVPMALGAESGVADRLRRCIPSQVRSSTMVRRVVNGVRGRARPVASAKADATLYPFSCVPVEEERSVLVLHDLRRFQPGFRKSGYNKVIAENVAKAAAVAVSWPHPFQQVLETFPNAKDKTVMIPLPTFHARPHDVANDPEEGFLLYPSSTAPHKNHTTLLEAMAMLQDYRLSCPGPLVEPEAGPLQSRAADLDLAGRVSFPGFVSVAELTQLYRRAWAVVVPSTWEAASGAIFEAFSWGLPVACADVAPLRAQAEFAGADVAYFDPYDPAALASAVRRIAADYASFAEASRRASQRLSGRTWADTAQDYDDLLTWVARDGVEPLPRSRFADVRFPGA